MLHNSFENEITNRLDNVINSINNFLVLSPGFVDCLRSKSELY